MKKKQIIHEWDEHMTCSMSCKIPRPIIEANEKSLDVLKDFWE